MALRGGLLESFSENSGLLGNIWHYVLDIGPMTGQPACMAKLPDAALTRRHQKTSVKGLWLLTHLQMQMNAALAGGARMHLQFQVKALLLQEWLCSLAMEVVIQTLSYHAWRLFQQTTL